MDSRGVAHMWLLRVIWSLPVGVEPKNHFTVLYGGFMLDAQKGIFPGIGGRNSRRDDPDWKSENDRIPLEFQAFTLSGHQHFERQ
jgi:hypothetical protein